LGWRAMFLINIVLGGAVIAGAITLLPDDEGDRTRPVDALGSVLLAATMLGLLYGLIDGSAHGWGAAPILCLTAGAGFFVLFGRRQVRADRPLIEPTLLRNRGFTSG